MPSHAEAVELLAVELGAQPIGQDPAVGTRVLKRHTDSARAALLAEAGEALQSGDLDTAARVLATAVLEAGDRGPTRYLVGIRTPNGTAVCLGPFPTRAAAEKAVQSGLPTAGAVGVFPLIPWPKRECPTRRGKR